jgi:predicted dehydrogenase
VSERPIRVAVVGTGEFGRNHVRVWRELEGAELVGVVDANPDRAQKIAAEFGVRALPGIESLKAEEVEAVSLAVPTKQHAAIGCRLLETGQDVLVEKPIASSLEEADRLIAAAKQGRRLLQIGHVERFNAAVVAVRNIVARPMFFEVHRMGIFTPRSLDIDVVYDVMIHDLDILLSLVQSEVDDIKAVGIPVVTDKVDIAHARLEFANGTVANLTASRVSTERVRKLRFFQEHEYVSLDFARQDVLRVRVQPGSAPTTAASANSDGTPAPFPGVNFEKVATSPEEPLRAELRSFLDCVRTRKAPLVDGQAGRRALALADRVMAGILDHARRVQLTAFSPQEAQ